MEQTTSWEDVSFTSREKKNIHFMEAQGFLSCQ